MAASLVPPARRTGSRRGGARWLPLVALAAVALAACGGAGASATVPRSSVGSSPSAAPTSSPTATPTPTATPIPTYPVSIVDDEGTTVHVAAEPVRIVSLTPAATETLFAIGAGPRVVAKVQDVTPYPPAADALPVVATYQGVDVEKIVALRADLVIAGGQGFTPSDAITQLRGLGIPVIVLSANSVAQALAGIRTVGLATGAAAAADDLAASMAAQIDQLKARTAGLSKPRVFYEIDATTDIYTVPAGSLYAELLTDAGADPITTDSSYKISLEAIVAANPAIILLGDGGYTKPADVEARPGWSTIAAVVSRKIFPVDDTLITRPGPRLVDGLRSLITALHPGVLP